MISKRIWMALFSTACLVTNHLMAGPAQADVYVPHEKRGTVWTTPLPTFLKTQVAGLRARYFYADINYTILVNANTPAVQVCRPISWQDRVTGCVLENKYIPVPTDFTLPNAYINTTPNNPVSFYNPTTGQLWDTNGTVRPWSGGLLYTYAYKATHGGSGLSGGEITMDDLNSGLNHAFGINLWGKLWLNATQGGFVAPALRADSAYRVNYQGNNPHIKMGTRFFIPANVTAQQLGLTTPAGSRILEGLQKYGAYVVDDSGWDCFYIQATPAAGAVLESARADMLKLMTAMQIVVP